MTSRSWLASAGALFVLFVTLSHAQAPAGQRGRGAGQGRGAAAAPAAPPITEQTLSAGNVRYRVVPVASGLFHPWSLGFLPDGGLLVAERNGQLRLIRNGVLLPT